METDNIFVSYTLNYIGTGKVLPFFFTYRWKNEPLARTLRKLYVKLGLVAVDNPECRTCSSLSRNDSTTTFSDFQQG
jgi:hypothetical protein